MVLAARAVDREVLTFHVLDRSDVVARQDQEEVAIVRGGNDLHLEGLVGRELDDVRAVDDADIDVTGAHGGDDRWCALNRDNLDLEALAFVEAAWPSQLIDGLRQRRRRADGCTELQ